MGWWVTTLVSGLTAVLVFEKVCGNSHQGKDANATERTSLMHHGDTNYGVTGMQYRFGRKVREAERSSQPREKSSFTSRVVRSLSWTGCKVSVDKQRE